MKKLSRVLCAVDVDTPGRAAFARALAIARTAGARLLIVCPVPPLQAFDQQGMERTMYLSALREEAEAAGVEVRASVQHGEAAGVVAVHAAARRADLIVVSAAHGRRDARPMGAVAEAVIRRATCPTLVVQESDRPKAVGFTRAVCAVELSASAETIVAQAHRLIDASKPDVTLLHVVDGPQGGLDTTFARGLIRDYYRHLSIAAFKRLRALVPKDRARTTRARIALGDAADEIRRVAGEFEADLLVVGASLRGRIGQRLHGVARQLLAERRCAVLAVPATPGRAGRGDQWPLAA